MAPPTFTVPTGHSSSSKTGADVHTLLKITRSYHCRVEIKTDFTRYEKIKKKAFDLAMRFDIDLEGFDGCPAAAPYLTASSSSCADITMWQTRMLKYLRKFRNNVTYN